VAIALGKLRVTISDIIESAYENLHHKQASKVDPDLLFINPYKIDIFD